MACSMESSHDRARAPVITYIVPCPLPYCVFVLIVLDSWVSHDGIANTAALAKLDGPNLEHVAAGVAVSRCWIALVL